MAEQQQNTIIFPAWMLKIAELRSLIVPVGFVLLISVLLVPLPPALLDIMISLNISLAVIVLLTTLYMKRALEFSVFPSLLLATTLLRLVLNIASTRLILTADASSPEEAMDVAGKVISAFGSFVAGDSLFVGVIIFSILMIVQFMVITKGAGRIAEVAARFTLDAMPGKQMAIDAELSNGMINETEARTRRDEISREADFFGAMDGASKFVKGDAVAGLIITVINIAGGFDNRRRCWQRDTLRIKDPGWIAPQDHPCLFDHFQCPRLCARINRIDRCLANSCKIDQFHRTRTRNMLSQIHLLDDHITRGPCLIRNRCPLYAEQRIEQ